MFERSWFSGTNVVKTRRQQARKHQMVSDLDKIAFYYLVMGRKDFIDIWQLIASECWEVSFDLSPWLSFKQTS